MWGSVFTRSWLIFLSSTLALLKGICLDVKYCEGWDPLFPLSGLNVLYTAGTVLRKCCFIKISDGGSNSSKKLFKFSALSSVIYRRDHKRKLDNFPWSLHFHILRPNNVNTFKLSLTFIFCSKKLKLNLILGGTVLRWINSRSVISIWSDQKS